MKSMKVFLLAVVTFFLFLSIFAGLLLYSLNETTLKPYSWDKYLNESELDQVVLSIVEKQFNGIDSPLRDEYEEDFQSMLLTVMKDYASSEWMNHKLDEMQIHIWDYLLERSDTIQPIAIPELKEALLNAFEQKLIEKGMSERQVAVIIDDIAQQVPGTIAFNEFLSLDEEQTSQIKKIYEQTQNGYKNVVWIALLLFVCGLVITFYPVFLLRWSGYVLGLIGFITFLFLFVLKVIPLKYFVEQSTSELQISLFNIIYHVFIDMVQGMSQSLIILIAAGILLVGLSYLSFMKKLDGKMRSKFMNNRMMMNIRAFIVLLLLVVVSWQFYQIRDFNSVELFL